jgi:hypothetical protein
MCPCTTISRSEIIPISRTELRLAIRNRNLHGSHFVMPSCRHVAILMTLTPDPPSIRMPAIFCPPTIASMLGHLQSMMHSSTSVNCTASADCMAVPANVRRMPSLNRGTNRSNCSRVIVTCMPAKSDVWFRSAAGWSRGLCKHCLARSGMLGFLGPPIHIVLCVGFLDPILRLFTDSILVRPLFRASTVVRRHQLYRRRY